MKIGRFFICFLLAFSMISSFAFAKGESEADSKYPEKIIELVCPASVGGSTDLAARSMATSMAKYLKQTIMVVNKPGGGGQLGMDYALKKKADGYTIVSSAIGNWTIYPALHSDAFYDYSNFRNIGRTEITPTVLVTRPSKNYKDLKGLTEYIKKNPKALKYGIAANGSVSELGVKAYMMLSGIPLESAIGIPFEGTGEATMAILGDHIDYMFVNVSPILDHIKSGSLIPLAVSVKQKELPNVPTFEELGLAGAGISSWKGLCVHPDTPEAIVKKLEAALLACTKDPEWIAMQEKLGVVPAFMSGKDFDTYLKNESETFKKIAASMQK